MGLDITAEDLCAAEGMLESRHMVRVETDSKRTQNTDDGFAVTRPSDLGNLVTNNKISCLPLHDELSENEAPWMLDSGAPWHFTYNANNFIELETIPPVPIYTANGWTDITGKGTVIFTVDGGTIRVYPIYHACSRHKYTPPVFGTVSSKRTPLKGECLRNNPYTKARRVLDLLPSTSK